MEKPVVIPTLTDIKENRIADMKRIICFSTPTHHAGLWEAMKEEYLKEEDLKKVWQHVKVELVESDIEEGCDGCIFNSEGLPCQAPWYFPLNCFGKEGKPNMIYKVKQDVKQKG